MTKRSPISAVYTLGLLAPLVALVVFRAAPSLDPELKSGSVHFWAVGGTSAAAAIASAVIVASSRSLQSTRLLFLALAFVSIAAIFSVHGLNTPGFVAHEYYESVQVSAWLSVSAGAVLVALSAAALPHRIESLVERHGSVLAGIILVSLGWYVALSFTAERWLDWVPTDRRSAQYGFSFASMGLLAFATWRYRQAYLFARLPSQAAMVVALAFLFEVQALLLWTPTWHLSWWTYHGLYALAFCALFVGWGMEARRAGSLRAIADALSMRDALAQLSRGLTSDIVDLVDAIEVKDVATFGHVSRVSSYALAIGKRLGLASSELRSLVLAAQLHDVGKISVPDAILAKPGPLTEEEYEIVKRHAARGDAIAQSVEILRPLAPIIRAHHERLNGSGYPDGLLGDQIPLPVRIIAVADTYDALTSTRPYRVAMGHAEAAEELRRVSGTELDARCVDALLEALTEERPAAAA